MSLIAGKKILAEKVSKFYNRSIKLKLKDNHIEMQSIHNNKEYSAHAERFFRNLSDKFSKYMTSISKNIYIVIE